MAGRLKVLHAFNRHRGGGGSDNAWDETIRLSQYHGINVGVFERDSRDLAAGLGGKFRAFASGIYSVEAVREFRQVLRNFQPDVLHAHELYPLISNWILPECTRAGVPVVMTCYDYRLTCPIATHYRNGTICTKCAGGREYRAIMNNCRSNIAESTAYAVRNIVTRRFRLVAGHVSHFIALAEFSRQWLISEVGACEDSVSVVPCAIPIPERPGDPENGTYAGFAGRFVREKGVELLVAAARKTGIPMALAGDAPSHPAIQPGDPVRCVETASREELLDFYRNARFMVVPSIWNEVFGIVAAEALSLGIPVVASRIGGLQGVVEDGVTGLLFEPGNVDDLAEKMSSLNNDPRCRRRMGEAGRMQAEKRFSEQGHVEGLLDAYGRARESFKRRRA